MNTADLTRWLITFSLGGLPPCPTDIWEWFDAFDPDDLLIKMTWRAMLLANSFSPSPAVVERYHEPDDPLEKAVWRTLLACNFNLPRDSNSLLWLAELVLEGMCSADQEVVGSADLWAALRGVCLPPTLGQQPFRVFAGVLGLGLLEDMERVEACRQERICWGAEEQKLAVWAAEVGRFATTLPSSRRRGTRLERG